MNSPTNEITEPTRRSIADELTVRGITPNGGIDELAFFSRIFDLKALPTRDSRRSEYPDMGADLWQHRVRNHDWEDGWFWTDDRIALLHAPDELFLQFLAEMVHPVVRPDPADREALLEIFNRHLAPEGWGIFEVSRIGAHPVYGARRSDMMPGPAIADAKILAQNLGDYVSRQVTRMEMALRGEPDLAIGTAKEFVETLCRTILGERRISLPPDDDLPALVKATVQSLDILPAGIADPSKWEKTITRLVNNLSSIGQSLAELRNAFGTGHGKTAAHVGLGSSHARLVVHMAATIGVFLYETHAATPGSA
jgi:hypothetical protein